MFCWKSFIPTIFEETETETGLYQSHVNTWPFVTFVTKMWPKLFCKTKKKNQNSTKNTETDQVTHLKWWHSVTVTTVTHFHTLRVVPSKIPNLEHKRSQYQDDWGCPSETKFRNLNICGTNEKSPVEALGLWYLWLSYVLCHILDFGWLA